MQYRRLLAAGLFAAMLLAPATADCLGVRPTVFLDMHDGDMKQIAPAELHSFDFFILPYNNSQKWVVKGTFDVNCVATIDFHVPGKPAYPPVNLTMTLWIMGSSDERLTKLGLEFTDPSGTLAPPEQPVNFWVQKEWPHQEQQPAVVTKTMVPRPDDQCLPTATGTGLVEHDMHDGDEKLLKTHEQGGKELLSITPYANKQTWSVQAEFDDECIASVNFDVPHKPNPPPVRLNARVWGMASIAGANKNAILFTDPSGTIASPNITLNAWLPSNSK